MLLKNRCFVGSLTLNSGTAAVRRTTEAALHVVPQAA
jgi:hypothetical protein